MVTTKTLRQLGPALLLALGLGRLAASPAAPDAEDAHPARMICEVSDERIDECSGLGASRRYPGYLWMHNDSGDVARFFVVSPQGHTVAVVSVAGAQAIDWEDMAICGKGNSAWVYAGDIGDNFEIRPNISIYRFHEPALPKSSGLDETAPTVTVQPQAMTLTYPDGPHNAETLIATPAGELIIITKSLEGSLIFETPRPFTPGASQKLALVGRYHFGHTGLPTRLATAGDLSPDGRRVAVCTYAEVHEWTLPARDPWHRVWTMTPEVFPLPPMKQAEGLCYSADGKHLFVSGEKRPTPVYEMVP